MSLGVPKKKKRMTKKFDSVGPDGGGENPQVMKINCISLPGSLLPSCFSPSFKLKVVKTQNRTVNLAV